MPRTRYAEQELAIIQEMYAAGVKILAGSDTGGFDAAPGFELHDELRMLVRAGLTPLQALRCATIEPAEFLGILDSHGTVEVGKVADLILLSGNPLHDIENLSRIEAVVLRGELFRRDGLDRFLATAESLAGDL
jgi:imidazolonepropionase-like amidohydrolase